VWLAVGVRVGDVGVREAVGLSVEGVKVWLAVGKAGKVAVWVGVRGGNGVAL
jgi:hypothetical protein